MSRGSEAYRAIYLSAPGRFCTILHAFTRNLPRYFISAWEKNPYACHWHKWRRSRERARGRWFNSRGPLVASAAGAQWPEPAILGAGELLQVVARAQTERVQAHEYWYQIAERARILRDVISAGDLAALLDALVSADCRHVDLMRMLSRELIDDIDKLSLLEVAVVANSYAHFDCFSNSLLVALSLHATRLLEVVAQAEIAGIDHGLLSDPKSLAVLARSLKSLGHRDPPLLCALVSVATQRADGLEFADLSAILVAVADLECSLGALGGIVDAFLSATLTKVSGARMASLCPALRALGLLQSAPLSAVGSPLQVVGPGQQVAEPTLREALVNQILVQLQDMSEPLALTEPSRFGSPHVSLPPFARPQFPAELWVAFDDEEREGSSATTGLPLGKAGPGEQGRVGPQVPKGAVVEWVEDQSPFADGAEAAVSAGTALTSESSMPLRRHWRWYSTAARRPLGAASGGGYAAFDASEMFARNRRGALVADALEGLRNLWRKEVLAHSQRATPRVAANVGGTGSGSAPSGRWRKNEVNRSAVSTGATPTAFVQATSLHHAASLHLPSAEIALMQTAAPFLREALRGVASTQLASCAEVYAMHALSSSGSTSPDKCVVAGDIMCEAVRKLSGFSAEDLVRLHDASIVFGVREEPLLARARQRHFPKAIRKSLRGRRFPGQPAQALAELGSPKLPTIGSALHTSAG